MIKNGYSISNSFNKAFVNASPVLSPLTWTIRLSDELLPFLKEESHHFSYQIKPLISNILTISVHALQEFQRDL